MVNTIKRTVETELFVVERKKKKKQEHKGSFIRKKPKVNWPLGVSGVVVVAQVLQL